MGLLLLFAGKEGEWSHCESYTHAYLKMCVKRVLNIKYAFISIRICRSVGVHEASMNRKGQN